MSSSTWKKHPFPNAISPVHFIALQPESVSSGQGQQVLETGEQELQHGRKPENTSSVPIDVERRQPFDGEHELHLDAENVQVDAGEHELQGR